MTDFAPQIPLELFAAESPSFDNFLIGDNAEAVTHLYQFASDSSARGACVIWGGGSVGKTHLLRAFKYLPRGKSDFLLFLKNDSVWPESAFFKGSELIVDDVDRCSEAQQAWLFTAFNHVVGRGGKVIASASSPPATWQMREDIRTRLASGPILELKPVPQDALHELLREHASRRGVQLSEEVLTYTLSHTTRDVGALCQLVAGLDRLSLSLKRPITIPLVRAYLAGTTAPISRYSEQK